MFSDEDCHVSTNPNYAIFPVGDTKFFPPHRKSTGWELGLRKYPVIEASQAKSMNEQKEIEYVEKINGTSISNSIKTPNSAPTTQNIFESPAAISLGRPEQKFNPMRGPKSSFKSNNIASTFLSGMKKSKYHMGELEEPNSDQKTKYFGPESKTKFYNTFQQLCTQADQVLGGFDTLHHIIKNKNENENIFFTAKRTLEAEGVLTPRRPATAESKSTTSFIKGNAQQRPQTAVPPINVNTFSHSAGVDRCYSQDSMDLAATAIDNSRKEHISNSKLDDNSYEDTAGEFNYNIKSPRAIFLSGCLKHSLHPRAQVLLRKRLSSTINLAHMGIGNQMAMVLAESLHNLPYLQVLNLCDNNLEDSGLSALLRSIRKHPTIEILDISQNIIDAEAADALARFMGNPECRLQCLRVSDANIDDSECARFVQVLMHNRHLKELDLSKNLLGKDENLNAVELVFETGGESLAELIRAGNCPLQTLNLHWNMIRLQGAEVLCDSIRYNKHLINLDLSYNALGRNAAGVLGAALFENKTIQVINIANNGIDAIGSFTLLVGLRENQSVRSLTIDGNPIGEQGARMLMKVAASQGHRLEISTKNCDFSVRSSDVRFNIDGMMIYPIY
jgi:Ran GTPase-activating protein (RanGAP) involved in mRNA processing and transport